MPRHAAGKEKDAGRDYGSVRQPVRSRLKAPRPERSIYSTPIHVTLVWDGWPGVALGRLARCGGPRAARAGARTATRVPRYVSSRGEPPLSPAVVYRIGRGYGDVKYIHESNFVCRHDTAACRPSRYDLGSPVARDLRNAENLEPSLPCLFQRSHFTRHTPPDSPRRRVRQDSHRSDSP